MTVYLAWSLGLIAILALVETLCLWRVLVRLRAISRDDERLAALTNSVILLTETTESGFHGLSRCLEQNARERARAMSRQQSVVGAARSGRSLSEIAAKERLSESEVYLRLHVAKQDQPTEWKADGSMFAR